MKSVCSLVLLATLSLAGCVHIENPIVTADTARIDERLVGTWTFKDEEGNLHLGTIEGHKTIKNALTVKDEVVKDEDELTFFMAKVGGIDLASDQDGYVVMYSFSKEGVVSVYLLDVDFWIAAVKGKELEGRIVRGGFLFPTEGCTVIAKRDKLVAFLEKHQNKCFESDAVVSIAPKKDKP